MMRGILYKNYHRYVVCVFMDLPWFYGIFNLVGLMNSSGDILSGCSL